MAFLESRQSNAFLEKSEYLVEDVTEADFNNFIAAANNAISSFDLEIRSTFHQTTRKRLFALINSTSDDLTQLATIHSPDEISFLKRVLDAMFETYNTPKYEIMAITSMQAVALAKAPTENARRTTQEGTETQGSSGQGLTMMQAEKMLKSLVEQGWFEKSRKGYYSLSPRALMELRGWLSETYNDVEDEEEGDGKRIKTCFGCREIITIVRMSSATRFKFADKLVGPTMRTEGLSMPIARHLHTAILQESRFQEVSPVQDRLDEQQLCRRESSCRYERETEEEEEWIQQRRFFRQTSIAPRHAREWRGRRADSCGR